MSAMSHWLRPVSTDDDRLPGHDVRPRDDADTDAVRDGRQHQLGAVHLTYLCRTQPQPPIPRCAIARDVRAVREPNATARRAAARAPVAAPRYRRRREIAPSGGGGPPCGALGAGDGAWRGAGRCEEDGWGRRDGVCYGGNRYEFARDAGIWNSRGLTELLFVCTVVRRVLGLHTIPRLIAYHTFLPVIILCCNTTHSSC